MFKKKKSHSNKSTKSFKVSLIPPSLEANRADSLISSLLTGTGARGFWDMLAGEPAKPATRASSEGNED